MLKFIGLRPKLYSLDYQRLAYLYLNENGEEVEVKNPTATSISRLVTANKFTAKGVRESVAAGFTINDYEYSLKTLNTKKVEVRRK